MLYVLHLFYNLPYAPTAHPTWLAGASIAGHVLASRAFAVAQSVGVYIHCAKLHEVDTMPLLRAALAAGGCSLQLAHEFGGTLGLQVIKANPLPLYTQHAHGHTHPGKRVYVPLVDDRDSNMRLLHIGERPRRAAAS